MKSDFEAHLREVENPDDTLQKCLFCKFLEDNKTCSRKHKVTDSGKQICDEWRYIA